MFSVDQFEGCLLGLALGDALGAPHEGGFSERLLWKLIGKTSKGERRWTDDTQMSLDIAESLVANSAVDAKDIALRFAKSYRWSRGYGASATKLLKEIGKGRDWQLINKAFFPTGSYGNGGAMRSPVLALAFAEHYEAMLQAVRLVTSITHAHAWAIEGAQLVASSVSFALQGNEPLEILRKLAPIASSKPFRDRHQIATRWITSGHLPKPFDLANMLGNGKVAHESCVTAIFIALHFIDKDFESMMNYIISCGGDVDTLGSMAGAIWGAKRGYSQLPSHRLQKLEQHARIMLLARELFAMTASDDVAES